MKKKGKLHQIAIVSIALVLFLILVSSTALASISETQITTTGAASMPAIYGNYIVWKNDHEGDLGNIMLYDLSSKKITQITNSGSASAPSIYDKKIVWTNHQNGNSDILMYDISTKKTSQITNSGGVGGEPAISGNIIAWDDCRGASQYCQIYMYDLSSHKETPIASDIAPSKISISGNKICWSDRWADWGPDFERTDIYMYDASTKKTTYITNSGYASDPSIYGNKIVFNDNLNGISGIFMYDLSTKKETLISRSGGSPAIYGNTIVWVDSRNGNEDIYAYDIITHQQIHTIDTSNQEDPHIYGNNIVWTDVADRNSNIFNIYSGAISFLPVAAFTASPTSGKKPLTVKFTDKSTDAYYWSWDFGDKTTSKDQSPTHKYTKAGKYTVSLTVKNAAGSNTKKISNYITLK